MKRKLEKLKGKRPAKKVATTSRADDVKRDQPVQRHEAAQCDRLRVALASTALGTVLVAGSKQGIAAILLGENPRRCYAELEELFPEAELDDATPAEDDAAAQVAAHVDDPTQPLKLRLDLRGTPFQVQVWNVVKRIAAGKTLTYADVARKIGAPRAMRAVGSSCAKCRHLFAVPCHRVTASGDALGDGEVKSGTMRGRLRPGGDRRAALLRREIELLAKRSDRTT